MHLVVVQHKQAKKVCSLLVCQKFVCGWIVGPAIAQMFHAAAYVVAHCLKRSGCKPIFSFVPSAEILRSSPTAGFQEFVQANISVMILAYYTVT